jgi:MFS transporter, MHS family, proline/betaine transporter
VAETPAFETAVVTHAVERAPPRVALREFGPRMLQAFGVSIVGCIASFIFVIYLVAYAINTMHLQPSAAFTCAVASSLVVVVLTPFVGALTDRIGRRPLILACGLLNLVFDYPLFLLAIRGGTFESLLLALVCNAVFQALYTGTIPSILAEMFPTRGSGRRAVWRLCAAGLHLAGLRHREPLRPGVLRYGRRCAERHRNPQHEGIRERLAGMNSPAPVGKQA